MGHYTYFIILALSLIGPLVLSFDKKVAFHKQWRFVFPAMIVPAIFFIVWDIFFTKNGVWSFNPAYISGIYIINIPLEEALFFFIVPYCCVFIYECIRIYFPRLHCSRSSDVVFFSIGFLLLVAVMFNYGKAYTFYTFLFNGIFMAIVFFLRRWLSSFNTKVFLYAYAVILLPFLAVNGFLTSIPVVLYNDAQNLGFRIFTIPFEDIFYGMLLVMMNIVIFEKLRSSRSIH